MSSTTLQRLPVEPIKPPTSSVILIQTTDPPDPIPPPSTQELLKASVRSIRTRKTLVARGLRPSLKYGRVQRRDLLRYRIKRPTALPSHMVKEVEKSKEIKEKEQDKKKRQGSQQEKTNMSPPRSKRHSSSVSSKASSPGASTPTSPPPKQAKNGMKDTDWADVTDPEERRRIQNRIAQRKFREKARENKEKAEREMRNQEHAGNSYRVPSVEDFMNDTEPAGLPWGSISFGHAINKSRESEGRRSSGRGTYVGEESYPGSALGLPYTQPQPPPPPQPFPVAVAPSYTSSNAEDAYMDDATVATYGYSPVMPTFGALPPR